MPIDALLAPVAGALPCGSDLSFSAAFDQITEMRREDDPSLSQGAWVTARKVADWPGVGRLCTELLTHRSKDLRLAMWLTEAWAMTRNYAGLADGLRLCTGLCQRHWDALHPQPDGDDHEQRIGNLAWLLQRVASLTPQLQQWALSPIAPIPHTGGAAQPLADAQDALSQLHALQAEVDARLGPEGPGFAKAKDALAHAIHHLGTALKGAPGVAPLGTEPPHRASQAVVHAHGAPESRAQALAQLQAVADFFRRTEPHSPVAYLADKAVHWGSLPLHEWLRLVVKDPGSMSHLQELLGLPSHDGA